jgi:hypothetical protein
MSDVELISLDLIDEHPDNPRLVIRQGVVERIKNSLPVGDNPQRYPKHHALIVVPVVSKDGTRYRIISGHHRRLAALGAGYKSVWCWVRDIDDQQAYMELSTSNSQSELDPLEIGVHAFVCLTRYGVLRQYADQVHMSPAAITRLRHAGEVVCSLDERSSYLGKAYHLAEIHKLPHECWHRCCQEVLRQNLSVSDVIGRVKRVIELTDDQTIIDAFTTGMVASCDRGNEVLDNDETDFYGKPVAVVQSPTFLDSPDDYDAENGTEDAGGVEIDGSVDTTTSKPINPAVRIPNADVRKWHVALEKLSDSVKKKVIESFWEHYPEPLAARWARAADEERSEILNSASPPKTVDQWFDKFWAVVHVKTAKGAAKKAWPKAVADCAKDRGQTTIEAAQFIVHRMSFFAESPAGNPTEHTPVHPAAWLNQQRYNDDEESWYR